jgi:hypothetical protein
MGDTHHDSPPRPKRRRRQDLLVLPEQLPLLESVEGHGEEVAKPLCGGCGRCAYTPLARSPRPRRRKP